MPCVHRSCGILLLLLLAHSGFAVTTFTVHPSLFTTTATTSRLDGISFADASTGLAVGRTGAIIGTNDATSWIAHTSGTTAHLHSIHAISNTLAVAVGASGIILSGAGGTWPFSWSSITNPDSQLNTLNCVTFAPGGTMGLAVGDGGIILQSASSGASWNLISSPTTVQLHAVSFAGTQNIGQKVAFAVGDAGKILRTTNSGLNWVSVEDSVLTEPLYGVQFYDSLGGFACGRHGTLLRTMDQGVSWTQLIPGVGDGLTGLVGINLHGVHVESSGAGFVVGDASGGGYISTTQDFDTWEQLTNMGTIPLYGIASATSDSIMNYNSHLDGGTSVDGYAVGGSGSVIDLGSLDTKNNR